MNWPEKTIGDLVALQRGHDLTETDREEGEVPIIGSAGPNGSHSKARAKGPGVTIGRSGGSIGKVTFVETDYWPHNTCIYVTDFKGNDQRFVAYLLRQIDLAQLNSGAAQPSLNRNFVYGVRIRFPKPQEQRRIAEVLTAYDDLMENNRRRMALLEEAARQLYAEWFVRLRYPGHARTRRADALPKGWRSVALGRITSKIGSGATPRGGEAAYLPAGIPLIRSQNVYDDSFVDDGLAFISEEQADALSHVTVQSRDILLNITGASVARCCMAPERYVSARVNST